MRIEARGITIRYRERVALDGVSLSLEPGRLIGLIGPNGSGKTTLARTLAGLLSASSGDVLYDGAPFRTYGRAAMARRLAFLAQSGGADWPLEVEAIVALGRSPHRAALGPISDVDLAAVERAIRAAELQALRRRRMSELSGGERARALMGRALAVEADWLIADEPIAALDPLHQLRAMEMLKREAKQGRGVLAVLHDLTLAARYCDRLIALKEGRVAADAPAHAFSAAQVAEVYGVEALVLERGADRFLLPWRENPAIP